MRVFLTVIVFLFVLLNQPLSAWSAPGLATKQQQLLALEVILGELENTYGMTRFKEEHFGVTIEGLRAKYTRLIDEAKTIEEDRGWIAVEQRSVLSRNQFQQLMVALGAEWRDGHLSLWKLSHNGATLGLNTASIGERLFVSGISEHSHHSGLSELEIQPNDEILSINGVPVVQAAERLMPYVQDSTYESRLRHALEFLLLRPYALLPEVPEGEIVELELQRGDRKFKARLPWIEIHDLRHTMARFPEYFGPNPMEKILKDSPFVFGFTSAVRSPFRQGLEGLPEGALIDVGAQLNNELKEVLMRMQQAQRDAIEFPEAFSQMSVDEMIQLSPRVPQASPASQGGPPILPVTRTPVHIVQWGGHSIGVIRIPSYNPPGGMAEMINEFRWLEKMVERLNNSVDAVIIDQQHNGGGMVYYMTRLLQLFGKEEMMPTITTDYRISEPLLHLFEEPSNKGDLVDGEENNFAENRMNDSWIQTLREAWEKGDGFSGQLPDFGNPSSLDAETGMVFPTNRTRLNPDIPLLILNDSRSASGGDFFPAILQQNERALIMGETSAGYGGPVILDHDSLPIADMKLRATVGQSILANGLPLENIGVTPDLPRYYTPTDLHSDFRLYASAALNVTVGLIHGMDVSDLQESLGQQQISEIPDLAPLAPEHYADTREVIASLMQSPAFASASGDEVPSNEELEKIQEAWVEFFQGVRQVEAQSPLTPEQWRMMILPLPEFIAHQDVIFSSLWRRGEVLDRLWDLEALARSQGLTQLSSLYMHLAAEISQLQGQYRFANPCELALTKHKKPLSAANQ